MSESTMALIRTILSFFTAVVTLITPVVVWRLNRKQGKKIDVVENKLDENHKQMNGNIDKLVETTKQLAISQEKARAKEEDKPKTGL